MGAGETVSVLFAETVAFAEIVTFEDEVALTIFTSLF
jgi:hypothetical protein